MNSTTKKYLYAVLTSYFIIVAMTNDAIGFIYRLKLAQAIKVKVGIYNQTENIREINMKE